MAETLQDQLDSVQAAIKVVEGGSQTIAEGDGRRFEHGDLATLYKRERYLKRQIARAAGGKGFKLSKIRPGGMR